MDGGDPGVRVDQLGQRGPLGLERCAAVRPRHGRPATRVPNDVTDHVQRDTCRFEEPVDGMPDAVTDLEPADEAHVRLEVAEPLRHAVPPVTLRVRRQPW